MRVGKLFWLPKVLNVPDTGREKCTRCPSVRKLTEVYSCANGVQYVKANNCSMLSAGRQRPTEPLTQWHG